MSEWQVSLMFQDSKSNKFWRARCLGANLEVNFGRIGSQGQTQAKRYDSPEDAARELEKQAREKYKKGYVDGDGGPSAATAAPAPAVPASATRASADAGRPPAGTAPERGRQRAAHPRHRTVPRRLRRRSRLCPG